MREFRILNSAASPGMMPNCNGVLKSFELKRFEMLFESFEERQLSDTHCRNATTSLRGLLVEQSSGVELETFEKRKLED